MKKLKVLMLFYSPYQKPRGYDYRQEFADPDNMYTEKDVQQALLSLGHEVSLLGIFNDITPLFEEIKENRPDIIFNMMEVFNDQTQLEKNMAAVLEILDIPYTGASSGNMYVCNNKALSKKILCYNCQKTFKVQRLSCNENDGKCKGNVIYKDQCLTCMGYYDPDEG